GAVIVWSAPRLAGARVGVLTGTLCQLDEVSHGLRRVVGEKLHTDRSGVGVQRRENTLGHNSPFRGKTAHRSPYSAAGTVSHPPGALRTYPSASPARTVRTGQDSPSGQRHVPPARLVGRRHVRHIRRHGRWGCVWTASDKSDKDAERTHARRVRRGPG